MTSSYWAAVASKAVDGRSNIFQALSRNKNNCINQWEHGLGQRPKVLSPSIFKGEGISFLLFLGIFIHRGNRPEMANVLGLTCQKFGKCLTWLCCCVTLPQTKEEQFFTHSFILKKLYNNWGSSGLHDAFVLEVASEDALPHPLQPPQPFKIIPHAHVIYGGTKVCSRKHPILSWDLQLQKIL